LIIFLFKGLFNFVTVGLFVFVCFFVFVFLVKDKYIKQKITKRILSQRFKPGSSFIFLNLFLIIFIFNYLSLMGYYPPITVQFELVGLCRFRGWFAAQVKKAVGGGWRRYISHFTPIGAPFFILTMLFFIEVIRLLIQPVTLSVRLMANILTGHILLALVLEGEAAFSLIFPLRLAGLEILVRGVQAAVFVLLLFFYRS